MDIDEIATKLRVVWRTYRKGDRCIVFGRNRALHLKSNWVTADVVSGAGGQEYALCMPDEIDNLIVALLILKRDIANADPKVSSL